MRHTRRVHLAAFSAAILFACLLSPSRCPSRAAEPANGETSQNVPQLTTVRGKALQRGDTIMLVAPARTPHKPKTLLAKTRLEAMGFQVIVPETLFRKLGYLAGTDSQRADELMAAFTNDDVDGVFCATGGFGTTRLLDMLDYDLIRKNPKVFIGYSDITGLHLAINQRSGLVTFHGPNVDYLGTEKGLTEFSSHYLFRAVAPKNEARFGSGAGYTIQPFGFRLSPNREYTAAVFRESCQLAAPRVMQSGKAQGRITGGNLSLITALMGTPYEIDTQGKILFIEDIGEAPYRIDRMLSTLRLAGKLDEAAGVVLGTFSYRFDQDTSNEGQTVDEVLASYFVDSNKPVIAGFPFGHHQCNATLPIGAVCEIDADNGLVRILREPTKSNPAP